MDVRYPRPLRPGDVIGVTAPSAGVAPDLRPRLEHNVAWLRERGFEVRLGECLGTPSHVSAPADQRTGELMAMLRDPAVRAVVPPWGGELGIDLLDRLDWDELATLEPTWCVGYSDTSTWLLPLTTRLGWATLHGPNLMETAYATPDGLLHWTTVAAAEPGAELTQTSPGRHRGPGFDDWQGAPGLERMTLDRAGTWHVVGGGGLDVTGRLVGGCIETVANLAGTSWGDVAALGETWSDDGLVVFLEAAEHDAFAIGRALHGVRLAGWFEHATAVLVGRTHAPDADGFTQHDAVRDALGGLDVPLVLDVEVGHTQPQLVLVGGALARVVVEPGRCALIQTLT